MVPLPYIPAPPVELALSTPVPEAFFNFETGPVLEERLNALKFDQIDVLKGPAELSVAGINPWLIFAEQAWPHADPTYEGSIFFTLPLQAGDFQFGCLRNPDGLLANEGTVLRINPMELHWLQPGPCASQHWIALQWEVPLHQLAEFERALNAAFAAWSAPGWQLPVMGPAAPRVPDIPAMSLRESNPMAAFVLAFSGSPGFNGC